METLDVTLLEAAVAGLLSFVSPCVLPLVLPYLAYVGGISLTAQDELGARVLTRRMFGHITCFVLGFVTIFVAFGASAGFFGGLIVDQQGIFAVLAGLVLVLFGLHFARVLPIPQLDYERRFRVGKPSGAVGAYVVGMSFAFGWSPCVGPILAAILTLAARRESAWYGGGLLAVYGLAMAVPFLLGAVFPRPFLSAARRFRQHGRLVDGLIAGLMVLTGLMIMTGTFWKMGLWMLRAFPIFARFS